MPGKNFPAIKPGARTNAAGRLVGNKILLSIPDHEYLAIRPYLEYLTLPARYTLHEPIEKLKFAHFPNSGLISLLVATEDGRTVEAGVVGNEGVAGIPIVVGLTSRAKTLRITGKSAAEVVAALNPTHIC